MSAVFNIAIKDLKLLSRDKAAMFFLLVFPVLMGVFFGVMYMGMGKQSSSGIKIAVVDDDQSTMSTKFIEHLKANQNLRFTAFCTMQPASLTPSKVMQQKESAIFRRP